MFYGAKECAMGFFDLVKDVFGGTGAASAAGGNVSIGANHAGSIVVVNGNVVSGGGASKDSGPQAEEDRVVGAEFVRIKAGADFEVSWSQGAPSAKIVAGSARMGSIRLELRGGELGIIDDGFSNWTGPSPKIAVSSACIEGIELSGAASFAGKEIAVEQFDAQLDGASRAAVAGRARKARWEASGSASVDALEFSCVELDLEASGAACFDGTASAICRLDLSGASSAKLAGDAAWEVKASGSARVEQSSGVASSCKARLSGSASLSFAAAGPCDLAASGASSIEFEALPGVPVSSLSFKASGAARIDCVERKDAPAKKGSSRGPRR
jgi:hypothetical protein